MFKVVGYTFMKNLDDTITRVKIGDNFKVSNYQEAISILEKVKMVLLLWLVISLLWRNINGIYCFIKRKCG